MNYYLCCENQILYTFESLKQLKEFLKTREPDYIFKIYIIKGVEI